MKFHGKDLQSKVFQALAMSWDGIGTSQSDRYHDIRESIWAEIQKELDGKKAVWTLDMEVRLQALGLAATAYREVFRIANSEEDSDVSGVVLKAAKAYETYLWSGKGGETDEGQMAQVPDFG